MTYETLLLQKAAEAAQGRLIDAYDALDTLGRAYAAQLRRAKRAQRASSAAWQALHVYKHEA